jgi:hypothetical protein
MTLVLIVLALNNESMVGTLTNDRLHPRNRRWSGRIDPHEVSNVSLQCSLDHGQSCRFCGGLQLTVRSNRHRGNVGINQSARALDQDRDDTQWPIVYGKQPGSSGLPQPQWFESRDARDLRARCPRRHEWVGGDALRRGEHRSGSLHRQSSNLRGLHGLKLGPSSILLERRDGWLGPQFDRGHGSGSKQSHRRSHCRAFGDRIRLQCRYRWQWPLCVYRAQQR